MGQKINRKEFDIKYTRGTGPGGQHKNKVETCVIITHIKSGLQEKCEDTRSKSKNEEIAYQRLIKRINEAIKTEKHEQFVKQKNELLKERGRIRTYNEQRNEVKDHRTGKIAPMDRVLNGEIDLLK